MKKIVFLTILAFITLISCNKEEHSSDFANQEKVAYVERIKSLESEGYDVYHELNSAPALSDSVAYVLANKKEGICVNAGGMHFSAQGTDKGENFEAGLGLWMGESWKRLKAIRLYSDLHINSLQFFFKNDAGYISCTKLFGKEDGIESWVYLKDEEYIKEMEICYDRYVDGLVLYVYNKYSEMKKAYVFGGGFASGKVFSSRLSSDMQIQGFHGSYGEHINSLGFYAYSERRFP